MSLFPIGFCIPAEKIVTFLPVKTKELSVIYPTKNHGSFDNYIFDKEEDYYKEYQSSIFAITRKKGGWDCLRHYEILANGCIPYFIDIEKCPENTLFRFPREMIKITNKYHNNYKNTSPMEFPSTPDTRDRPGTYTPSRVRKSYGISFNSRHKRQAWNLYTSPWNKAS